MRRITIYQGNASIQVLDNDTQTELKKYCEEISKIFEAEHISFLETSEATAILRPSEITGIVVENLSTLDNGVQKQAKIIEKEEVDIITDVD